MGALIGVTLWLDRALGGKRLMLTRFSSFRWREISLVGIRAYSWDSPGKAMMGLSRLWPDWIVS